MTVAWFSLGLECGHSKAVKRPLADRVPPEGSLVNCVGCSETDGSDRIVMARVAAVELMSVGPE